MLQLCSGREVHTTHLYKALTLVVLLQPKNPVLNPLLGLLGIVVGPITGLVGCKRQNLRIDR